MPKMYGLFALLLISFAIGAAWLFRYETIGNYKRAGLEYPKGEAYPEYVVFAYNRFDRWTRCFELVVANPLLQRADSESGAYEGPSVIRSCP